MLTGKFLSFVRGNGAQVLQIALVSDEHDDDVLIGVIPQFLEPSSNVLVCCMLGDVVDQQCADGTSVVGRGDCSVTLLASYRESAATRDQHCHSIANDGVKTVRKDLPLWHQKRDLARQGFLMTTTQVVINTRRRPRE